MFEAFISANASMGNSWRSAGDEDAERPGAVYALDPVQLDVAGRRGATDPRLRPRRIDPGPVVGGPFGEQLDDIGAVEGPEVVARHRGRSRPVSQRLPDPPQKIVPDAHVRFFFHHERKDSRGGSGRSRVPNQAFIQKGP